jgi:hypothetical protein
LEDAPETLRALRSTDERHSSKLALLQDGKHLRLLGRGVKNFFRYTTVLFEDFQMLPAVYVKHIIVLKTDFSALWQFPFLYVG